MTDETTQHEMLYRAGDDLEPQWYCPCGQWSFEMVELPHRTEATSKAEAEISFDVHIGRRGDEQLRQHWKARLGRLGLGWLV